MEANIGTLVVVVAHETVERANLCPAYAQLLLGIALEATDVRADHWYSEETKHYDR